MRNVIFYPTYTYALQMRKRAASSVTPDSFGTLHTTPHAYFLESWDVWGDERNIIDGVERKLIVQSLLSQQDELSSTAGTIEAIARFIGDYAGLPNLRTESQRIVQEFHVATDKTNVTEYTVCSVIVNYFNELDEKHLIEQGDAITYLSDVIPPAQYSFVAYPMLTLPMQQFFKDRKESLDSITGVLSSDNFWENQQGDIPPITVLKPTGIDAQPLHIQRELERLIATLRNKELGNTMRIGLISPNIQALYVRLAPVLLRMATLQENKITLSLQTRVPFTHTEFGKALFAFWSLLLQEPSWKEATTTFARSPYAEISGDVSRSTLARSLNTYVRSHQGVTPADAWMQLKEKFTTPDYFEEIITSFDSKTGLSYFTGLANSLFAGDEVARRCEVGAIGALHDIYDKAHAYLRDPYDVRYLLESVQIPISYCCSNYSHETELIVRDTDVEIICMDKQALGSLTPESFDVLVVADATSDDYSVIDKPGALESLRLALELPEKTKRIEEAYTTIASLRDAAKEKLVFSIPQKNAQAEETYPALFYSELAAHASEIQEEILGEDDLVATLTVCDTETCVQMREHDGYETWPSTTKEALRSFSLIDMIPTVQEDGAVVPVLSPTDIEIYHDCPYKWFISKRIRPESLDAGFDALAAGNFVHAVFCSLYARLHELGIKRITSDNLEEAHRILQETLESCMADQMIKKRGYIPMDKNQEGIYERLVTALHDNLDYQALCFSGFDPAQFEYEITQDDGVDYAHARLRGRVDRVDTNKQGDFIVIDYKGSVKKDAGTKAETREEVILPAYVQALVYAQALKKLQGRKPYGAFYLNYKAKDTKNLLAGSYNPVQLDIGRFASKKSEVVLSFDVYLDQIEELCIPLIDALRAGMIAPNPQSADSCNWCPAYACPKRRGSAL